MAATREDEKVPRRRSKRLRKESSGELSIEELFPDDMAYDADVEALYPDIYEEPESDTGSAATPHRKLQNIDEELAARMKHLGHERSGTSSPQASATTRGQKRRSLHEEVIQSGSGKVHGVEVVRSWRDQISLRLRRGSSEIDRAPPLTSLTICNAFR